MTLGRRFLNNRHDIIDDRIDVTTRGLMGLTVTCARCHDHKYDPIPTEDYYSLYGVFASSREPGDAPSPLRLVDEDQPDNSRRLRARSTGTTRCGGTTSVPAVVVGLETGNHFRTAVVASKWPTPSRRRTILLTARVFVNRVWGHLFGSYLVDTPSDFGTRSPEPPLAELLDDLAVEFLRHDWSVKWLIRELVLSVDLSTNVGIGDSDLERDDPENQLLRSDESPTTGLRSDARFLALCQRATARAIHWRSVGRHQRRPSRRRVAVCTPTSIDRTSQVVSRV